MNLSGNLSSESTNSSNETNAAINASLDDIDLVALICKNYIGPAVCIFGVMGNILNLVVLVKGKLKETPYLYLKALSLTDMLALVLSFIHLTISSKSRSFHWQFFDAYIFFPLVNFLIASSVWLTVGVSIDRFVSVKEPLWARTKTSLYRARIRIGAITFLALCITIPRLLCFELVEYGERYRINPTAFRASKSYRIYDIICISLFHVAPLIIFFSTNAYLVYAVQKARSIRQKYDIRNNKERHWQTEQRRLTITLISIVCLSILAIVPSTVCDFTRLLHIPFSFYHKLRHISNIMLLVNLSANFLLYCAFNKRFACVIKSIFGAGLIRVKLSIRRTRTTRYSKTETNMFIPVELLRM